MRQGWTLTTGYSFLGVALTSDGIEQAELSFEAAEDDTEVVYVSYPHWLETHSKSEHAHLLDDYQPV